MPFTPAVLHLSWEAPDQDPHSPLNAPSAYTIEAGSARGLSDLAVVRTAGPELGFVTPMADGTYYVRVRSANACGTSPPSKTSKIRVRDSVAQGKPNPLVLLDTVHGTQERFGSKGYVRVMGQVRNGWNAAPAPFVRVTASFEGSGRQLGVSTTTYVNGSSGILTHSHIVTDTVLEPGATGCFVMFAEFSKPEVTGAGLWAAADQFDIEPLDRQVDLDGPMSTKPDAFGDLIVSGRLKNSGRTPTGFNETWVEARDAAGEVRDCHPAAVRGSTVRLDDVLTQTGLAPDQHVQFENNTEAVFTAVRSIRLWFTWDRTDDTESSAETPHYHALTEHLLRLLDGDIQATSPEEIATLRDALRDEARSIEEHLLAAARH